MEEPARVYLCVHRRVTEDAEYKTYKNVANNVLEMCVQIERDKKR